MKFDPTKPVQTRDGRKARIICADSKALKNGVAYPLVAIIEAHPIVRDRSAETVIECRGDGLATMTGTEAPYDLVNIPERKVETRYVFPSLYGPKGSLTTQVTSTFNSGRCLGRLDFITEDGELIDVVFTKEKEDDIGKN